MFYNLCYSKMMASIVNKFRVIPLISSLKLPTKILSVYHEPRALTIKCASTNSAAQTQTVEDLLKIWYKKFKDNRIGEPLDSIANILAHTLKSDKIAVVYQNKEKILSQDEIQEVDKMCGKRMKRMPVQYIIGEWAFRELTLRLRPPVFIPRPETEILVELALNDARSHDVTHILEPCCGSGAICLSLLNQLENVEVMAFDKCSKACELTKENAKLLNLSDRLQVVNCEVNSFNIGSYDLIISNPPYVLSDDMKCLQPEILLFEDLEALDGGGDGLNVVKDILYISSQYLNFGGKLFLEVDPSHPQLIKTLLARKEDLGLSYLRPHKDFTGEERFVEIIKI